MNTFSKKPISIACTVALIAAVAGQMLTSTALANSAGTIDSVRVRRIDLDPATDAAARRVLNRLSEAALEACGASPFSLKEVQDAIRGSDCWHDSLAEVIARIDSPRLTAVFEAQIERRRHAS